MALSRNPANEMNAILMNTQAFSTRPSHIPRGTWPCCPGGPEAASEPWPGLAVLKGGPHPLPQSPSPDAHRALSAQHWSLCPSSSRISQADGLTFRYPLRIFVENTASQQSLSTETEIEATMPPPSPLSRVVARHRHIFAL